MKQKNNMKFLYVTLGIIATALVVIAVVLVMNTVTNMKDKQSVSNEQTATEENSSAPTPAAGTSHTSQTGNPDTAASDESGMYAGQTEPTEKPIDIYYVENNFDAAASDIKPTVSEEGWYIENVGCLEGVKTSEFTYDEEHIRGFENAVFFVMRKFGYEKIKEISRLTIDTRTVYPNEISSLVLISLNIGNGYGLFIDASDLGSVGYGTGIEVSPIINKNRDYIINLQYLKNNDKFQWSEKQIESFQKALYQFINEEGIELGMAIIDPVLLDYNDEENACYISIDTYTKEELTLFVTYYENTDKFVFTTW